jgi:hypothetical protein
MSGGLLFWIAQFDAAVVSQSNLRTVISTVLPLHVGSGPQIFETALIPVLVIGGLASALLVWLGLVAFLRRQTSSYLFVVLALGTLVLKVWVGGLALGNVIPISQHHLIEHALDGSMAVFLLAAVYYVRTSPGHRSNNSDWSEEHDGSTGPPDSR